MNKITFFSKIAILIILSLYNKFSIAQTCTPGNTQYMNNWYFGRGAGIKFNPNNTINVLTNGQINQREGCASISDNNGDILFYTDGQTVYNRQHNIMTNGSNLLGHASSTQSAIIIPRPGVNHQYYIFTIGVMLESVGIRYSLVDMNLNNGNGEIIHNQKNILLYSNNGGTVEKISATYHSNNTDIWVVYHEFNNNSYRAHLVNQNGIQSPVISSIGLNIGSNWDATGYMKFSPNSQRLATTLGGNSRVVQILDFNNTTGRLSNLQFIIMPNNLGACYGIEFSPNNNLLYVSTLNNPALNSFGSILQYNLSLNDFVNISLNPFLIALSNSINYGALQLGPNQVIYSAKENGVNNGNLHLGSIESPNNIGASAQYIENNILLNGKLSLIGLPTFLNPILNCSLPIKLLDFSISNIPNTHIKKISWSIDNISETKEILLERSYNGITYEKIYSFKEQQKKYEYNDYTKNSNFDITYYRLKLIDINDIISFSKIITTAENNKSQTDINIYPNPFDNIINISLSSELSESSNILIQNSIGEIILNETISPIELKEYKINSSNLKEGIYFISIKNSTNSWTKKIIK